MLKINDDQIKVFEEISLSKFEEEMVLHSKVFSPSLCKGVSEEQLCKTIHNVVKRAETTYGFTNRGSIRLYIELMLLYGKGFDIDPQYPEIKEILTFSDSQMIRAKHLYEWVMEYQKKVSGANNINTQAALSNFSNYLGAPFKINSDHFNDEVIQTLKSLFPQKVEYIGRKNLDSLINMASDEGKKHGLFLSSGIDLLVVLMFLFGHACVNDPFYSCVLSALKDKEFTSPEARTNGLRLEALNWLRKNQLT